MSIYDAIRVQPAIRSAWERYCEDDNDSALDQALSVYGLIRLENGDIEDEE